MSRRLIIALVLAAVAVLVVVLATRDGDDDAYVVRAVFDSGGFMVKGELVRVAGADVGEIESVDVTLPGEISSYEDGRPQAISGKAVIVMRINDPSFQDFRRDASCHIRPQSLIGEKFVDCRPTLPRAPGSPPPPLLREIPEGQPGEGQYLLPLENNSTSVDPDLINDINSLPYAQRFRLILNELGASLAGRGEDIREAVKRANPALRDAGRLIGILDEQREQLTQLAADSEEILGPFSREREHVAGFFANAGAAGEASSERGDELEESLRKFPEFLRQFRATMRSLGAFSDAASPVFADFDRASPAFAEATRLLTPFSAASTVALKSLGASGEVAGPLLRATTPVLRKTRDLARSGVVPTNELSRFLTSTQRTKGFDGLVDLIYNGAATNNGFDQYGHFARSLVTLTACFEYTVTPESQCTSNFNFGAEASSSSFADHYRLLQEKVESQGGDSGTSGGTAAGQPQQRRPAPISPGIPAAPAGPGLGENQQLGAEGLPSVPQRALLDYLLGP
jgi:phospholipid/cholesterol/gamma-HCH transport system substrate-binding protein